MRYALFALALLLSACASAPRNERPQSIPVLMYHHVDDTMEPGEEVVSTKQFNDQLTFLKNEGYTTITISELAQFMVGERPLPLKTVAITLDDGWKWNLVAAEILNQHNMKATFYIISGTFNHPLYLSKSEIRALSWNPNFEIGAHTKTHFMAWIKNLKLLPFEIMNGEVQDSKLEIEAVIQKPVTSLAWPFGYTRPAALDFAQKVGFTSTVLVSPNSDSNRVGGPTLEIERLNIDGRCSMDIFKSMVQTGKLTRCDS